MKRTLCAVFVIVSLILSLTGCGENGRAAMDEVYAEYNNLAADCTYIKQDGKETSTFSLKGKEEKNCCITVDLGEKKSFNTVVLKESGQNVTLFEIYGSNDKDTGYEFLYQSDCIEGGHTCFLGDVEYRYLRIFVSESSDNFRLTDFAVYDIKDENAKNLRVTSYLVATGVTEDTDFSGLDAVTDLIVFGMAKYDAKGNIYFVDGNGNETTEDKYAEMLDIVKTAVGDRDINLICDISMPYNDNHVDINSMMSDENVDNLCANIAAFVDKYGFDGFDMDYEYPENKSEWKLYNNFLRKLDKALPDRIISLAIAPWDLQFDEDVIEIIDRVEVMLYDMFTAHGYHSIFPVTANGIRKTIKGGFSAYKIDLGVPFYSRPTNKLGYWGNYNSFEGQLDRYTNLIRYNGFDHSGNPMTAPQYINSVQMISDKTAFAVDAGLGGIMVWHLSCDLPYDNELSLFRAINDTKIAKQ